MADEMEVEMQAGGLSIDTYHKLGRSVTTGSTFDWDVAWPSALVELERKTANYRADNPKRLATVT